MAELRAPLPTELGRLRILSPTADGWADRMGFMNKDSVFDLLDHYYEAGGNFIDTANTYHSEQSEQMIGEWAEERQNRDSLVLATKFSLDYRSHAIGRGPRAANFSGNSRRCIHVAVRDSLKKLRTDYIDIYYIHYWDYTTSIKEIMDTLHILVEQGKVLYLGVSDTPAWIVAAANTYAIENGKTPFSIYQGRWSLLHRDFERDIIPMARHFGMALAPWAVLGGGKFQSHTRTVSRDYRQAFPSSPGMPVGGTRSSTVQSEDEIKISEALDKVASEHGENVKGTAVALAYVMSKAANVFPVVGGRLAEHWSDNIKALSLKLTDEQIKYLESIKPFDLGFPHNFIPADPNITGSSSLIAKTSELKFPNARTFTSL
ncbi:Aldo/keto reductase [Penicillium malachiteum]|uniref:Aldo/keto reductase n=1 Tax=Penicillium malachiteum TaxID=1324776 RepID=UPI00254767F5|nr:Aldo/keto reductase [Penicillium malachiteum]KAJ5735321.1 Aldo/keto reductase [Penicillium malachiteum]